ncbi:bile acid:sodium symporter family protein [Phenylobacterium sp.]|uniref:bile acid:sodium symporter family protein n=1 Tax=Phenylobacterium sp. TaxID=1871053 RepID=UPI002E337ADA|nr:bile acid:sodium symporter family protein [Phenylobacterium sp.]HEX4711022.1 bile acid:sodium symporter family protein [Phenylobacterium sp.]
MLSRVTVDKYLLLIISMVVAASFLPARGEAAIGFGWATKVAIGLVFFLHGARLPRDAVIRGLIHWRLHLVVLTATFGLFPLLCLGIAALPAWITPPALAGGLVFLGCLPSTIQSSIGFTVIARGDVAAAVASASASNLLGIVVTPILVGLLLHAKGAISAGSAWSIALQLLAPFVAGQVLRQWIGAWVADHAKLVQIIDRGSILLVVYTAFSGAVVEGVWSQIGALDLVRLLVICGVLLGAVLATTLFTARALRFSKPDEIAIVFCGSKKSLASGVPMAGVLFPAATAGLALLPLMLFHQIQLMACAVIAQRYAQRADLEAGKG